jgi:hypothetical protein
MDTYIIWLTKLVLAHLLTDFIFQPASWVEDRNKKHFASGYLYLHGFITALAALIFVGWQYWITILIILVTHILIDGWKSYRPDKTKYFLIDQVLHLVVILSCWYVIFLHRDDLFSAWEEINTRKNIVLLTSFVFVTLPAGILINQLTRKWREQVTDAASLGNAGKWIGIIERVIILALVLNNQYETMGLLIAAKSLLRFSETNRPEIKTEYLLIGTLISVTIAIITGLVAMKIISLEL